MELLSKDLTLGFYNDTGIVNLPVPQYDAGRVISIGFTNDGQRFEIPESTSVFLKAVKPDGTQINTNEWCSIQDNHVVIQISKQLSAVPGTVKCELVLGDAAGNQYTSNRFHIIVGKPIHNDDHLISSDVYQDVSGIYLELDTIKNHPGNTKNPHAVTKVQVGLGNADNTADADKPVSTAQRQALDLKADVQSPVLTGTPKAPTAPAGTDTAQIATTAFLQRGISDHNVSLTSHSDMRSLISTLTAQVNTLGDITQSVILPDENGNLSFPGTVAALAFIGNASSADTAVNDKNGNDITETYATKAEADALKKSVSDGKKTVADAITAKGVTTAADAAFPTMVENIGKIETCLRWKNTSNGTYKFVPDGDRWIANNRGINSSTATSSWKVTIPPSETHTPISIGYRTAAETADKLSVTVNGSLLLSPSGGMMPSESTLTFEAPPSDQPQDIELTAVYTKDGSVHSYGDMAYVVLPPAGGQTGQYKYQRKSVTPGTSAKTIYADQGYDGLCSVSVSAGGGAITSLGSLSIIENKGMYSTNGFFVCITQVENNSKLILNGGAKLMGSSTGELFQISVIKCYANILYIPSSGSIENSTGRNCFVAKINL